MIKLSLMKKGTLIMASSAIVLSSMLFASGEVFLNSSFAQDNMTTATNETGAMMGGNQTNQTGGNQTQQGPLEQLGEAIGGVFGGGGNQSQ
jgi:hypothetical protein